MFLLGSRILSRQAFAGPERQKKTRFAGRTGEEKETFYLPPVILSSIMFSVFFRFSRTAYFLPGASCPGGFGYDIMENTEQQELHRKGRENRCPV